MCESAGISLLYVSVRYFAFFSLEVPWGAGRPGAVDLEVRHFDWHQKNRNGIYAAVTELWPDPRMFGSIWLDRITLHSTPYFPILIE